MIHEEDLTRFHILLTDRTLLEEKVAN